MRRSEGSGWESGGEGRFLTVHEIDFVKVRAPGMQVSRAMGLQYNQSRALKEMHVHTHTHTLIRRKGIEFACDTSGFLSLSDSMSPKKLVFQQSLYQEITKNKSQIVSPLAP